MNILVEKRASVKIGGRELVTTALKIVNCYNLECELAIKYFSTSFYFKS